ncbi:MAG: hypothetical protein SF051_15455 [Elusimicrobiota bacterium]|nr:hypothetical protein [Elusimicrobiota bacterium]
MLLLASWLSGCAGLMYEILWAKRLGLLFGSAAVAQAAVLAAFLGGLAAGSFRLGPRADAAASPTRFFARLEWVVAALGLLAPLLLRLAEGPWRWAGPAGVFAHAFVMGGAIPALARAAGGETQRSVGRLYAANAAGAAFGCLAATFLVVPALGLEKGFAVGALLNLLAAVAATLAAAAPVTAAAPPRERAAEADDWPLALVVMFVSGAAALVYETAWTRLLALVLGSSVHSFAEMLAALILGLAVGGAFAASGALRRPAPALVLGVTGLATAAAVLATLPLCPRLPYLFLKLRPGFGAGEASFLAYEAVKFATCALLLLAPAVALGVSLPVAARLAAGDEGDRGGRVGSVLAANAFGNALGAAAGVWLLPRLGVEGLLRAGASVHLLAGAAVLWRARPAARAWTGAALAAGLAVCAFAPRWDSRLVSRGAFRGTAKPAATFADFAADAAPMKTLFHRDDREATVGVIDYGGGKLALHVNGKADASTGTDMGTQILMGSLPLLLKPDARSMLLIGWGSGVSAGSALRHPLGNLDAVELTPAVIEGSRHFDRVNGLPTTDPRLTIFVEDAKSYLLRPGPLYDVIASEPSNPWMAGVADLFSVEFYARARRRLRPGGLFVQWFHLYEMDDAGFALVLRTFRAVFPRVTVWRVPFTGDALLIGSVEPLPFDHDAFERAFLRPEVWNDLARVDIGAPTTVLSLQAAGEETAAALAGEGPVNSELRPFLEHAAPRAFFRKSVVRALSLADDRGDPERRRGLLLERYLAARGRPLQPREFKDWAGVGHPSAEAAGVELMLREWARLYPRDAARETAAVLIRRGW